MANTAIENPRDVPGAQAIIRRLCALQAYVVTEVLGYDSPCDCFCGEEGFWPLESADDYKNEGAALRFIEEAVLQAVAETRVAALAASPPDTGALCDRYAKALIVIRQGCDHPNGRSGHGEFYEAMEWAGKIADEALMTESERAAQELPPDTAATALASDWETIDAVLSTANAEDYEVGHAALNRLRFARLLPPDTPLQGYIVPEGDERCTFTMDACVCMKRKGHDGLHACAHGDWRSPDTGDTA